MSETGIIASVLAVVGGLVWAVRIEGKVLSHDDSYERLREDLTYIRARVDELAKRP